MGGTKAGAVMPAVSDAQGYFECGPYRLWGYNACARMQTEAYCYENTQMLFGGHCCPVPGTL